MVYILIVIDYGFLCLGVREWYWLYRLLFVSDCYTFDNKIIGFVCVIDYRLYIYIIYINYNVNKIDINKKY